VLIPKKVVNIVEHASAAQTGAHANVTSAASRNSPVKEEAMVFRGQTRKRRAARRPWTKQDEREFRGHSKKKSMFKTVVRSMKRTAGALRQKAYRLGLSLGHRRSGKSKKKN
jgi:hypothetical protein